MVRTARRDRRGHQAQPDPRDRRAPPAQAWSSKARPAACLRGGVSKVTVDTAGGAAKVSVEFAMADAAGTPDHPADGQGFEFYVSKLVPATATKPRRGRASSTAPTGGTTTTPTKTLVPTSERGNTDAAVATLVT